MTPEEVSIADKLLAHTLDLMRLEAHERVRILQLLDRMGQEIAEELRRANITAIRRERLNELLRQVAAAIDGYYAQIEGYSSAAMTAAARTKANAVVNAIQNTILISTEPSLPTQAFLSRIATNALVTGAPTAEWWKRQAKETAFRFATAVRQGLLSGETNEQIVRRVTGSRATGEPGIIAVSKSNARALVHSSIQSAANAAAMETYRKNGDVVKGYRQISTLDSRTSLTCIAYSGAEWDLDYKPINGNKLPFNGGTPRHWNCRSFIVPITKTFKELGIDLPEPARSQRASADGPVKADMTFAQFLKRMGREWQDEVLGKGRADLWRSGKITLQQLVDLKGNPLTLAQLERKYARKG